MLRKLFVHTSHYSLGSLLTTLAGLISFPFLARIFSVADYGLMNLISATLMVLVGLGKLGVQHAIVRYYSEIAAGRRPWGLAGLYSTAVLGMAATGLAATGLWAGLVSLVPAGWLSDPRLPRLYLLTSVLILTGVMDSCLSSLVRAQQMSRLLVTYQVIKKYLGLVLIIGSLLLVARSLPVFYAANILTDAAAIAVLGLVLFRSGGSRPRPASFSVPLFKEMLALGIPMMIGYELAGTILSVGDRYVIQGLMGGASVGLYAAAYNLCQYVQTVGIASLGQAVAPIYMRLWDEQGPEATKAFVDRTLRYYVLLAAPMVAGLSAVGPELLPFVASEKYLAGAAIIPLVIAGMIVDGATVIVGAGLFLHRETRVIMRLVVGSAVLNIALNVLLIPHMGILGAALATLLSYGALSASMAASGARHLAVTIPWGGLLKAGVLSAGMYLVVVPLHVDGRLGTIALRVVAGVVVYGAAIVVADRGARDALRFGLDRLRSFDVL